MKNAMDRWSRRISAKLVASVLALAIVFLSLAIYSVEMGRMSIEEAIGRESVDLANHFALSVDRGIYSKMHEMMIISMGNNMRGFLTASNAEFEAMEDVELYIDQQDDEWTSVPLNETSPFMEEMLTNSLSLDLISRLHEHYVREHGMEVYGEVQVSNEYGALVAMTTRSADYRQNDDAWWQETVLEGLRVSEVELDPLSGDYGISISVAVTDADDQFLGVMKAFVGTAPIIMEAQFETSVYETTEVEIITTDKRLVYSTHAFSTFEDVSSYEYVQQIEGETGYFVSEEGGRERLYSYAVSHGYIEYEGSSWVFLMSHDTAEVLQQVTVLRSEILVMSTLLLLAFLGVALLLATNVTIPIRALKDASQRMAAGHLDDRVTVKNRDELGDLAEAFNAMASELGVLYADLEAKVQERTRELGTANDKLKILGSVTRHDALNQLSVLRGWLSVLEENTSDEDSKKYLAKVLQSAEVLEAQLRFTGMYEKVGLSSPQWIDAKLAVDTNMPGLDLEGIRVMNSLKGLEVFADPLFPRVFRNLADNAARHGKKTTRIVFTYEERADGLAIIVEDDGVGVPDEMKTLIFERVKDKVTGRAGFGLYLSRAILAITDIVIREAGRPDGGARFEIIVPKGRYRLSGAAPPKASA